MAKQTVFIDSPAALTTKNKQIIINESETSFSLPAEDIQLITLNHSQISISSQVISLLAENNIALITCDKKHLPISLCLPANKCTRQYEMAQIQLKASKPLKKQLWQTIIRSKIINQAQVLRLLNKPYLKVQDYAKNVSSGDSSNRESVAAKVYFNLLLPDSRRKGIYTASLDFGYALIRAAIARSLCASGFLPFCGIHHKNIQNPFNLADDLIEPFRPLVDFLVVSNYIESPLTHDSKLILYRIFEYSLKIDGLELSLEECINMTVHRFKKALEASNCSFFTPPCIAEMKPIEVE